MSLESQFKSNILLEKIEPIAVIKNELEIAMDQDIIGADIKNEIDIEYHLLSEDLIKSEPISNIENLVDTENTSYGNLISESTYKKGKAKMDNCRLKHYCNKCTYKTLWKKNLEKHKVIHLKPNKIQFLCYHCPYKSNYKHVLKRHVFKHFKNGEVPFHCYICDFVTPKRNLIIEHFKKHSEHRSKWDETEYKNQVEAYNKKRKVKPNKIQYLCYHCPYKSNYKFSLGRHVFSHFKNEEVPFHCYLCDFMTSKRNLIIKHFKKHPEHHSKWDETEYKNQIEAYTKKIIRRYYCKKCEFNTYQDVKLKLHELSHEAERDDQHLKYCCDQCKYKTFRLRNLNKHKKLHLKPKKISYFYCYHCTYKCKEKPSLYKHIVTHFKNERVPFYCYICDFVTPKRDLIIEHFKKHPEHRSKWNETEYKNHIEAYTKKIIRYYCKKCEFNTNQDVKLKQHELSHEAKRDDQHLKYQCDQCKYKTFRLGDFNLHKLLHLKPEEIPYLYCYHCSYRSVQKCNIRSHIFVHFKNEEVPFHCYICDFVTRKRDLIIEHFKKHPEHHSKCDETDYKSSLIVVKKRYKCKKCVLTTYQQTKLKQHELSHEAERDDEHLKYHCDQCKYKTFRLGDFNRHKKLHLNPEEIQYFYCYHCSYKAIEKRALKTHILGHCKNANLKTRKRKSNTKYIKKHSKVQGKSKINKRTK